MSVLSIFFLLTVHLQMFSDFVNECDVGRKGFNASAMVANEVKVDGHAAKAASVSA